MTMAAAIKQADLDWPALEDSLNERGYALLEKLLTTEECMGLKALYEQRELFRSRVVMENHGYGRGEYQYFSYPLQSLVARLRMQFYPHLALIANRWHELLGIETRYPATHAEFLERCHAAGQTRPTPLLLQYQEGDYNCLHRDLYGEHVFPLQMAVLLSAPGKDFSGGEFVLTEQRPRMQSRVEVVPLQQGGAVIFPVSLRPAQGVRGAHRVTMRHGVSRLHSGNRHTLGIIFHDAL